MPDEYDLYLRKSKGRMGISRQRTITTAHIERLGGKIRHEYEDTDSTAWSAADAPSAPRKAYERMLAGLTPGVGIAAWHGDRILRDGEDAAGLTRRCLQAGVHVIETARGGTYDLSTANGRKRLRDDASDAEYEVDHNRERILIWQAERRAAGLWHGGPRPLGYDFDPGAPGGIRPRKAEAAPLAAAANALLDGRTLYAVTRDAHAAGLTGSKGALPKPENLRRLLLSPRNAGLYDDLTAGAWEPIIDPGKWRALRVLLSDPARRTGPGPEVSHLLTRNGLCGECGAWVTAASGQRGPRYRCTVPVRRLPSERSPGKGNRDLRRHVTAPLEQVDAYVTALAIGRMKRADAHLLLREDHAADRAALLAEEARLSALYDEQWDLYRAKVISARELAAGREDIDRDREAVRQQLAMLRQADALAPMLADPEAAWEEMGIDGRRAVVAALMHVTIGHARRGRPPGWQPGEPYFDVDTIDVRWVRALPSDG